ncbi:MAG: class I SAM-dependent methyltransferase, partial [Gammaproteobacteria bacterium]|nr:class I SAM-dependent methyltransferase [Gammaproteobacteria bacterium]
MSDDHSPRGYVKDASYPTTYFRELAPVWLNYVAALGGVEPRRLDRNFSYLELGSGPGFSTIIHAACYPAGEFHACDFNSESIAMGERYADDLAIQNVVFHAASFDELLERDLPDFDFIVLHGVYSWIGTPARQTIHHLIRKQLKPGGLVYVGYNCMPGWTL